MEQLLNKADVDRTFSFNKTQWAEAAVLMIAPGWTLRVYEHDTGAQVIGFAPSNGIGLSIQPFFRDDNSLPEMVIVGNYFPLGMMAPVTDELKREMESVARTEIGAAYTLTLKHEIRDKLEVFEFWITEL